MVVVVWEWEEDSSIWTPYSANVTRFLETSAQKGQMDVNLGEVDPSLACYVVDLRMKTQTRLETGMIRQIKRSLYPASFPCGHGIVWQWYNDLRWVSFDMETAHFIEKQYQTDRNCTIDLESTNLGIPNYIELSRMVQVNKFTNYVRQIQRKVDVSFQYPIDNGNIAAVKRFAINDSKNASALLSSASGTTNAASISNGQSVSNRGRSKEKQLESEHKRRRVTSDGSNDLLHLYCKAATKLNDLEEDCSICFEKLQDLSGFHERSSNAPPSLDVRELKKCPHRFHGTCLLALIKTSSKEGWMQCPTCKVIQGIKQGIQPRDGTMNITRQGQSLPGHPGCGMITIIYNFTTGIQGQEHPHPGKHYHASGFPRHCYLPDNVKGKKVLKLLQKAWKRRLIFTIATSNTTGQEDTIVWNEIHHKTEPFSNISGHGFPDPHYLDNVLTELSIQGVDDNDEQ